MPSMKFVTTCEELRAVYKPAAERSLRKEMRKLDKHSRNFIERSPFVLIGSQDGRGNGDVTPKGDKPGFVSILDDTTIAIPDRPGNNRLDTLENIIKNPSIGLLFLIPGMNETLRVNGEARVTVDPEFRSRFTVEGRPPLSVVVVEVASVYMHCAKAFLRSKLWEPASWPRRDEMPTLGEILSDQLATETDGADTDREIAEIYAKTMW